MNEEEVKEIIREETLKTIKSKLNSSMIFTYISNLEQENIQLKEDFAVLKKLQMISNNILNELEEYLVKIINNSANIEKITCSNILDYLKELKEKYK